MSVLYKIGQLEHQIYWIMTVSWFKVEEEIDDLLYLLHVSINIKEHRLTFRIQLPIICSTIRILRKLPFILIILFPFRLLKYLNKGIWISTSIFLVNDIERLENLLVTRNNYICNFGSFQVRFFAFIIVGACRRVVVMHLKCVLLVINCY